LASELITWAGRTLSGSDRFGDWVTQADKFDGWWDSPDPKGEVVERPYADGDYDLPVYNQARLITVGGNLHAKSHAQLHEAMTFLTGPMRGRFTVAGHGSTQWADAVRNSGVKFTPVTDTLAQWQVRLKCPDPRKYGASRTIPLVTGSYVDLFHRGNYNASAAVSVTGNAPGGYTVREPGGVYYEVTGSLSPGETHTIDFRTGIFRINGYIVAGETGVSDIWYIEPGVNKPMKITSSGTVNATATVVDTYI
jgi:hypothetical protein